jgi:uncharacterized protein (UPF0261 family)
MNKTIALIGTLDTKGDIYLFVKRAIEERGFNTLTIDVGILGKPGFPPEISRDHIAHLGNSSIKILIEKADRGYGIEVMSRGLSRLLPKLFADGKFHGVLALGGGGGTSIATSGMRMLPLGVPKVMVSTIAGQDVSGFIGIKDIVMFPSIVDVTGINSINSEIFTRAVGAVCGMVSSSVERGEGKPVIAATMFGNTTPAVKTGSSILENAGYEVLVFPCSGSSGRTMESLIESGFITGVLDITTTELADELAGGVLSAGKNRLNAAAEHKIAQIVVPGCLDMVNFWGRDTIPTKYRGRLFYQHTPNITLMRTNIEENKTLGEIIAEKLNRSRGEVSIYLPLKGLSMIDAPGEPFWWPEADKALFDGIKANIRRGIPVIEMDCNINDTLFGTACAEKLIELISK